jgi:hypothetical protein
MTFVEGLGAKMVCKQSGFENRGIVLVALLKDEAADGEVDEVGLALGTFLHGGLDEPKRDFGDAEVVNENWLSVCAGIREEDLGAATQRVDVFLPILEQVEADTWVVERAWTSKLFDDGESLWNCGVDQIWRARSRPFIREVFSR